MLECGVELVADLAATVRHAQNIVQADGSDDDPRVGFKEDIKRIRGIIPMRDHTHILEWPADAPGSENKGTCRLIAFKEFTVAALESQNLVRVIRGQYF